MTTTNKGNKMKFAIYQLPEDNAKIRDMYFLSPAEIEAISDEYDLVGTVDAKSLDDVFQIGNTEHELIDMVAEMRSISVGDIIHNLTTNETHVVDRIGFVKINMKEAV